MGRMMTAHEKNLSKKLHKIGSVFLKAREVSECEAIIGVTFIPTKRSNTAVLQGMIGHIW